MSHQVRALDETVQAVYAQGHACHRVALLLTSRVIAIQYDRAIVRSLGDCGPLRL